jgi:hypothetical protein
MYGFALLSSTNFRQTMQIAMQYHQLATPLAEIFFRETTGRGVWTIAPLAHAVVDASLYKFIVELQFGRTVSLQRDFMGPTFAPLEVHGTRSKGSPHPWRSRSRIRAFASMRWPVDRSQTRTISMPAPGR